MTRGLIMTMQRAFEIFALDTRIAYIMEYCDGFVANAYHYAAPGTCRYWGRNGQNHFVAGSYDRKRSHGVGPAWVAFSGRDGRLASA